MGRHTMNTAIYAVKIPHTIATEIYNNYYNDNYMAFLENPSRLDDMEVEEADSLLCGFSAEKSQYPGHGKTDHMVFDLMMATDNSEPYREVNPIYDENEKITHYFGIRVADSMDDKLEYFIKILPEEAVKNYETYAKPILEKYKIFQDPQLFIVQNTM